MFKLLRRFFNPIQWLSSAAILVVALVPGLIANQMAYNASQLNWIRDESALVSPELWAFWSAATLSLSLLNLLLSRPLMQPAIVAGALSALLLLVTLMAVGAAVWGGNMSWIDFFVVLALALFIVRCCLGLKDSSRRITMVQAIGSGLLVLYLIFPWQFWILLNLTETQRNTVAEIVFGQAFIDAKQTAETCHEFQQYAGSPINLTITTSKQTVSYDRPYRLYTNKIFEFSYLGQKQRGVIWVLVEQKRLYRSSYSNRSTPTGSTEKFTTETTFKVVSSDPYATSKLTSFNCTSP